MPAFLLEEFQKYRYHASVGDVIKQLNENTICLNHSDINFIPKILCVHVLFVPMTTLKKKLGVGSIDDSITDVANHQYMRYRVYYIYDPKATKFLTFLCVFLERIIKFLTIFYTNLGTNQKNRDGKEKSSFNQYMIFDDSYVKDNT